MCLGKRLADASFFLSYIFKGGRYHKPYWPPWATLPHLFYFFV